MAVAVEVEPLAAQPPRRRGVDGHTRVRRRLQLAVTAAEVW